MGRTRRCVQLRVSAPATASPRPHSRTVGFRHQCDTDVTQYAAKRTRAEMHDATKASKDRVVERLLVHARNNSAVPEQVFVKCSR